MRRHSGLQQYNEALVLASENGLKVVQRPGQFLLYRINPHAERNIFIGSRSTVQGLRSLLSKVVVTH